MIGIISVEVGIFKQEVSMKGDDLALTGYNEKGMISLYVNLFAAVAYWAKMCSHVSGDPKTEFSIIMYTYADYMITCPLLTLDLLWTLNLPYKLTYSLFVGLTLFAGFLSSGHPQPGYSVP